jgi:hypothetical protein
VTQLRSRNFDDTTSKPDPQTGPNPSSHVLTKKASDDAQQLKGAVGLRDVVVATGHFIAGEAPDLLVDRLLAFLGEKTGEEVSIAVLGGERDSGFLR